MWYKLNSVVVLRERIIVVIDTKIDEVRAYWDRRPCNVRHSAKEPGTPGYFEDVRARRYLVEPHIPDFAAFRDSRGKKVLEIGCGIGTDGAMFAEAGASYVGADLSAESLLLAKDCFNAFGVRGRFYASNAESLSAVVPVEPYDLVYSFGVIHHSPHPEHIVAEAKKYMHQGSQLRIMLYAKYSWKSAMIALGLDQPEAQFGCPIALTYSVAEVKELLKDFNVVSVRKAHIFPYQIAPYVKYEYVKAFPWNTMSDRLRHHVAEYLGWHLLVVATLK